MLTVRAVPGARRSEVADASGAVLRIRIAAPAVEGKANDELRSFVAGLFGTRRSAVTIVQGDRGRNKVVRVEGVEAPPEELLA